MPRAEFVPRPSAELGPRPRAELLPRPRAELLPRPLAETAPVRNANKYKMNGAAGSLRTYAQRNEEVLARRSRAISVSDSLQPSDREAPPPSSYASAGAGSEERERVYVLTPVTIKKQRCC